MNQHVVDLSHCHKIDPPYCTVYNKYTAVLRIFRSYKIDPPYCTVYNKYTAVLRIFRSYKIDSPYCTVYNKYTAVLHYTENPLTHFHYRESTLSRPFSLPQNRPTLLYNVHTVYNSTQQCWAFFILTKSTHPIVQYTINTQQCWEFSVHTKSIQPTVQYTISTQQCCITQKIH